MNVRHKDDTVRVTHGQAGDDIGPAGYAHRLSDDLIPGQVHRHEMRGEFSLSHVGRDGGNLAARREDVHLPDLPVDFDGDIFPRDNAAVVQILADAAERVAADAAVRAVHIIDPHRSVGNFRRADEHHAVSADAKMAVGKADGKAFRTFDRPLQTVEVDIVIAAGLHLGEGQK